MHQGVGGGVVEPETCSGSDTGGGMDQHDGGALFSVVRRVVYS